MKPIDATRQALRALEAYAVPSADATPVKLDADPLPKHASNVAKPMCPIANPIAVAIVTRANAFVPNRRHAPTIASAPSKPPANAASIKYDDM